MMKKILFTLAFLVCLVSSAQIKPNHDGVNLTPLTTVEINALTGMLEGDIQYNSTTSSLWRYNGTTWADTSVGSSQLSDLSDVNTSTATNRNVLVADGVDFESRPLVEADISDFGSYVDLTTNQSIGGEKTFTSQMLIGNSLSDQNIFSMRYVSTSNLSSLQSGHGNIYFQNDGRLTINNGVNSAQTGTFDLSGNTQRRDYDLPNASGTIALTSDITGAGLPVDDTTALVQDPVDNTKQVRIDAGAITTATTRTITMPDAPVDLGGLTSANIADGSITTTDIANGTITAIDISNGVVDNTKLSTMPALTIKGNNTGGAASTSDLTVAEVNTMLGSSDNQTASEVPITDAAGYYIGTDAEAMGQEIGASLGGKVENTISGRTGTALNSIQLETRAQINSNGAPASGEAVICSDCSPAEVITSATVTMDGWKMYDDQTADAATITLSDCDPGETLTVYINRASAPTLAGTGLTFNALPNTTAFAAATQMMMIFEVAYDGTTIDYYYVER